MQSTWKIELGNVELTAANTSLSQPFFIFSLIFVYLINKNSRKGRTLHSDEANPCDALEPTENIVALEKIIKTIGQ